MNVHNYIKVVGILWADKKINRTEAAFVLYCHYSYYASTGIPTLLTFLDSNAMYNGRTTASILQAL